MRKSIKHILLAGLTVASTAMAVNAQTLTQDWKVTEGLPAAADARWGTGFGGKVYTNDKSVPQILSFDAEGNKTVVAASAAGTAIAVDDAGNFIVNSGFPNAASSTTFKILPAGGSEMKELTVTLPNGVTAGRMDFMGRAVGNVMSETGGAFYITPASSGKIAKIFVANGVQVADKSKAFDASVACAADGHVQPADNNPESDNFLARPARAQADFTGLTKVGSSNLTAGGDVVTLDGTMFTIETSGDNYLDGFQVVDRTSNEVVATHDAEFKTAAAKPNQNALSVEKVDEYTAYIYQYVPGQMAAKYTFSIPKPMPKLEARNAYAYDIKVEKVENKYVVSYRLNAPAESVKLQIYADGKLAEEIEGTNLAEYGDEAKTTVNNLNEIELDETMIPKDALVQFKVAVTSATVAEPTLIGKTYKFYHPSSVAIDNDPESPNFGRILVTEAMPSKATGYHSSGENQGLYAFDPTMNPVKNAEGKYAFKGGIDLQTKLPNGKTAYEPRKVRIAEDGRIFVSGQNSNGVALWEVNPSDLNAAFTPVIKGTANADTYEITNAAGEFIAAPNVSMDVRGAGDDLKVLMLSTNAAGIGYSSNGFRTDEYNLGEATTWDAAPSKAIEALSHKYAIVYGNTSVVYDNEGGAWFASSRATASETEPTLVHINAEGVEDYKVDSNDKGGFYGGAGIRFNADFSLLAVGTTGKTITVFEVSKAENGAPVLTQKYKFETTIGTNTNDIAWDCANNLYFVGNSGEWFKAVALPREDGTVVVDAASDYDLTISSDEYPAQLFMIGSATDWDPSEGLTLKKGENGVYTGSVTGPCNFGFTTVLDEDWEVVNANRYGFATDNAAVTLNEAMPIVKGSGTIRVAEEGLFELTVDLKNMTVLVAGEAPVVYPEKLYLLGSVEPNAWDPADETHVANQVSEGVYTIENISILAAGEDNYGYFAFTATPSASWDEVNAHRYGPAVTDTELADKTMSPIGLNGDTSFKIKSGNYVITVDLTTNTIYANRLGDSVNDAAAEAAKVVAGNGEIRIIGEAGAVSIYNAAGQAIAINSKDAQFFVPGGVYIVVVDGKTTKVLVK